MLVYRSLVWLVMGSWRNEESMPKGGGLVVKVKKGRKA